LSAQQRIDRYRDEILSGPIVKTMFKLGAPLLAVQLIHLSYNLVDAYWLSRYSQYALAVPRQVFPTLMLFNAAIMAIGAANMAILSQYVGAKMYEKLSETASKLFTVSMLFSGLLAATYFFLAPHIFTYVVRSPPEILGSVIAYARVISADLVGMAFSSAMSTIMQSVGDTRTPATVQAIGAVANIILDPILIVGLGPIPAMGAAGAAIATVGSRLAAAIPLIILFRRRYPYIRVRLTLSIDREWIGMTLYAALPVFTMVAANSLAFTFQNTLVNMFGAVAAAAFAIGFIVMDIADSALWGLTQATTIMIGQTLGAGNTRRAKEIAIKGAHALFLIILAGAALVLTIREQIIGVFTSDPRIVAEADRFISIMALTLPFFGVFFMGMAAGRGSGRTLMPSLFAVIRLWGIRLGLGYLMAVWFGMGVLGVWISFALSNVVGGALSYAWIRLGNWARPIIRRKPEVVQPVPRIAVRAPMPTSAQQCDPGNAQKQNPCSDGQ